MGGIYRFTDNFALSTKSLNLWAMDCCFHDEVLWRLKHVFSYKVTKSTYLVFTILRIYEFQKYVDWQSLWGAYTPKPCRAHDCLI